MQRFVSLIVVALCSLGTAVAGEPVKFTEFYKALNRDGLAWMDGACPGVERTCSIWMMGLAKPVLVRLNGDVVDVVAVRSPPGTGVQDLAKAIDSVALGLGADADDMKSLFDAVADGHRGELLANLKCCRIDRVGKLDGDGVVRIRQNP